MDASERLRLPEHGAQHFGGAATSLLDRLRAALRPHDTGAAGARVAGNADLAGLLAVAEVPGALAAGLIGARARPVRAVLFDKNPARNWALGWHQDRTICVTKRIDASGFGPWTTKHGLQHVEPPFAIIERMVTLRIHLDPVDVDNAPLLIAPGSHQLGKLAERDISATVARCGEEVCLAAPGDVWAYATPVLHASARSRSGRRRRVLQVDYSADDLPHGLSWLGV